MSEVPKDKPTDADRAMSQVPKHEPTDADRAAIEVPKYEQTDAECAVLNKQARRQMEQPVAPRLNVVGDYRGCRVEYDHPNSVVAHSLLKEAIGTADDDFIRGLLAQLYEFVGIEDSASVETDLNFLLSVIKNEKNNDHSTQCI